MAGVGVLVTLFLTETTLNIQSYIGCIMLGDTKGFDEITKMMSEKQDVSQIKDQLLS